MHTNASLSFGVLYHIFQYKLRHWAAAKIAMAVEAGIMGYQMWQNGSQFHDGDGIVTKGVENTIRNVGRLAKEGMSDTDREIIEIMLGI